MTCPQSHSLEETGAGLRPYQAVPRLVLSELLYVYL